MQIKIKALKLENFKGIKDLTIDFKDTTNIYGDNAVGKTTIFDAYSWLLWDKDSLNRKDFAIKPYDKNGEEVHNLESIVEGDFSFDDTDLNLKKIYKEVWTKKRGSTQAEFTGHTTDYYINAVPVKKKEYNERIESVLSEDNFNLLSNPLYFNQFLVKTERREILLSLIEDVKPEDIITKNKDLEDLDLETYTVDELKKIAKDSARKINKDIESIPARIDELDKSKIHDIDFDALEFRKRSTLPAIKEIDEKLADASKMADGMTEITEKITALQKEKSDLAEKYQNKRFEVNLKNKNVLLEKEHDKLALEEAKKNIEKLKDLVEKAREEWQEVHKEQYQGDFKCPTCGQDLLPDQIEKTMANFNKKKSEKLANIEEKAKDLKIKIEECEKLIAIYEVKEYKEEDLPTEPIRLQEIDKELDEAKAKLSDFSLDDKKDLLEKKDSLNADLEEINKKLSLQGQNEKIDERIKELEGQEKELAKAYEEQQRIIYLCEEYTKAYVDLVSDKINDSFDLVKFKLFENQINGGITETCEATFKGVPYSDLNNAAKINAGLDVINSLSDKLDLKVPIFIDNAESVNELIKTDTQLVRLVVSKDKELKIEVEE
ncbi:MAG: AAA family ATPase [Peptoniphilus harei]|nr:AAA family ATPase [Peptoniphilus harei]